MSRTSPAGSRSASGHFAVDTGRWQVSSNGGQHPLWSRDGRELFFHRRRRQDDGGAKSQDPSSATETGAAVCGGSAYVNIARNYDASPDGKRFYVERTRRDPERGRP